MFNKWTAADNEFLLFSATAVVAAGAAAERFISFNNLHSKKIEKKIERRKNVKK